MKEHLDPLMKWVKVLRFLATHSEDGGDKNAEENKGNGSSSTSILISLSNYFDLIVSLFNKQQSHEKTINSYLSNHILQ